jgi:SAM-dependent methyltransferase
MLSLFKFRRARGPVDLALGMSGVRLGERLLQVGPGEPALFAAAAGKTGLTGHAAAVVTTPAARAALEAAAVHEGVLVEVSEAIGTWPYADASFDVAILDGNDLLARDASALSVAGAELLRVVRGGGRVLAVHAIPRGWGRLVGLDTADAGDVAPRLTQFLERAGFGPVRFLAAREGLTFVEAFRPRP